MIRSFFFLSSIIAMTTHAANLRGPLVFKETCDASAVVNIADDLFAVASDEDNLLRFYRWSQRGKPVHTNNLNTLFLGKKKSPEMDIEAVTRLGQRIFWITSHGRKANGDPAPARSKLFALEITNAQAEITVRIVPGFYTNLITDLAREPKLAAFGLSAAAELAPKSSGALNIEGMTATPDGSLLIGFRNPIPKGRALIVPLLNPNEVLSSGSPRFGDAITLDLGGLGLRGMETVSSGYYLLAGPNNGGAPCKFFFWNGKGSEPQPVSGINFSTLNPEGICAINTGDKTELLLLSDDGSRKFDGKECKDLPESERQFRAFRFTP